MAITLVLTSLRAQTDEWPAVFDPSRVLAMDTNDWDTVVADSSLSIRKPAMT